MDLMKVILDWLQCGNVLYALKSGFITDMTIMIIFSMLLKMEQTSSLVSGREMFYNVPQVWNLFFTDFKTINIMTQIEKYIERLKTLQNLYEEGQPQHNAFGIAIVEANEMIVKNCSIPAVVGRSEQLVCSCGSRLVKTTGGYHCGNAKCSV